MSSETVIEARGLTKIYDAKTLSRSGLLGHIVGAEPLASGARPAIASIDLDVLKGESVGILGVNGAGKTTLLSVLSGVLKPTSGSLRRRGSLLPLLGVGTNFTPELTGRENAEFNLLVMGVSRREARRRLAAIETFADVGHHFDAPLWTYSSGMAARVAFAAALEVDADTLVIDETLSVGDMSFREKCEAVLQGMRQNGRTMLLVTHNPPLISRMCTRGIVLDAGRKVFDGAPKDAVDAYREIRAAIEKRKSGARSIDERAAPVGVVVNRVQFRISQGDDGSRVGLISLALRANEAVERPVMGLSIRASTGVLLAELRMAPIVGLDHLPHGASHRVEIRFRQRLLRGSYVGEVAIGDLSRAAGMDQAAVVGTHSFRIDILEASEQAGLIDMAMRIEPTAAVSCPVGERHVHE